MPHLFRFAGCYGSSTWQQSVTNKSTSMGYDYYGQVFEGWRKSIPLKNLDSLEMLGHDINPCGLRCDHTSVRSIPWILGC